MVSRQRITVQLTKLPLRATTNAFKAIGSIRVFALANLAHYLKQQVMRGSTRL